VKRPRVGGGVGGTEGQINDVGVNVIGTVGCGPIAVAEVTMMVPVNERGIMGVIKVCEVAVNIVELEIVILGVEDELIVNE
jgi:hypothetical protein